MLKETPTYLLEETQFMEQTHCITTNNNRGTYIFQLHYLCKITITSAHSINNNSSNNNYNNKDVDTALLYIITEEDDKRVVKLVVENSEFLLTLKHSLPIIDPL